MIVYLQILADDAVALHKRGDVVALKPAGAPVTATERKHFLVVDDWIDVEWEAFFTKSPAVRCVAYPYGRLNATGDVVQISTRKANLSALPDFANVIDREKDKSPKKTSELNLLNVAAVAGSIEMKVARGAK